MAKKNTAPVAPVAPVVSAVVVALLKDSQAGFDTGTSKAKEAAIQADALDCINLTPVKRIDAIMDLYKDHFPSASVKSAFSAALAILVADKPVQAVAATSKSGAVTYSAPTDNEKEPRVTLEPADAVAKLGGNTLKKVAVTAREALGTANAKGAGRAKTATRLPFLQEVAAYLKDEALRAQLVAALHTAGFDLKPYDKPKVRVPQAPAPTIGEQLAK
jgi:hypothetical protein